MITKDQAHRILEDIQRNALVIKGFRNMLDLLSEENDALFRDIRGMLNGNQKNKKGISKTA